MNLKSSIDSFDEGIGKLMAKHGDTVALDSNNQEKVQKNDVMKPVRFDKFPRKCLLGGRCTRVNNFTQGLLIKYCDLKYRIIFLKLWKAS